MEIDVVILSDAKTEFQGLMTEGCLESLLASETSVKFNPVIIESNINAEYPNCDSVIYDTSEFNFNKRMNDGAKLGKAEYIAFCNNDLEFKPNWASNIIKAMKEHNLQSGSAWCSLSRFHKGITPTGRVVIGWRTSMEFCGWCFILTRKAWEAIGGLDEEFSFWCADDATIEQLKAKGFKHGLVTSARVNHLGEGTLRNVSASDKESMTFAQVVKFNRKYDKNVWGMGKG